MKFMLDSFFACLFFAAPSLLVWPAATLYLKEREGKGSGRLRIETSYLENLFPLMMNIITTNPLNARAQFGERSHR